VFVLLYCDRKKRSFKAFPDSLSQKESLFRPRREEREKGEEDILADKGEGAARSVHPSENSSGFALGRHPNMATSAGEEARTQQLMRKGEEGIGMKS